MHPGPQRAHQSPPCSGAHSVFYTPIHDMYTLKDMFYASWTTNPHWKSLSDSAPPRRYMTSNASEVARNLANWVWQSNLRAQFGGIWWQISSSSAEQFLKLKICLNFTTKTWVLGLGFSTLGFWVLNSGPGFHLGRSVLKFRSWIQDLNSGPGFALLKYPISRASSYSDSLLLHTITNHR